MNKDHIIGSSLTSLVLLIAYIIGGRKSNQNIELSFEVLNSLKDIASKKGITPE